MAAHSVEFWNFGILISGIGCTLEAEARVSDSAWCCLFVGDFRGYTVSGVTFSFNSTKQISKQ